MSANRASGPPGEPNSLPASCHSDLKIEEDLTQAPSSLLVDSALRLLARWLVAGVRKDTPSAASGPLVDPQNPVDCAVPPEVGLDRG
jgi:hypothetical protein